MRVCEICSELLIRRAHEWSVHFESRRTCSKRCASILRQPHRPVIASRYRYIKVNGRKVAEHRYVMEQELGRTLRADEQVHHKNHDRLDNRPENLEVVSSAEHGLRHTVQPITKPCVICGCTFAPHKTKRSRAQTCGPACKSALLSIRNAERKANR
jgi:hypothetical protein